MSPARARADDLAILFQFPCASGWLHRLSRITVTFVSLLNRGSIRGGTCSLPVIIGRSGFTPFDDL